jgi:hypothetical protein
MLEGFFLYSPKEILLNLFTIWSLSAMLGGRDGCLEFEGWAT